MKLISQKQIKTFQKLKGFNAFLSTVRTQVLELLI